MRKSFGDNLVLDGIDLEVATGEVLVIIGLSGSGKSTLLRCVNLLEPIQAGRIMFEGEVITEKASTSPRYGSGSGSSSSSSTCSPPHRDGQPDARRAQDPEAAAEGGGDRARELLEVVGLPRRRQHP